MTPSQARRAFGNRVAHWLDSRDAWGFGSLDALAQDVRYGVRTLRRNKGYAIAAIGTLALAIGANTTMLSVIDQVLLRPLPFRDAERLFFIAESDAKGNYRAASYLTFLDWQRQARSLSGIAFVRGGGRSLQTPSGPERVTFAAVTPGYFGILGARPLVGRTFLPDEERGAADQVAVLSYEFWQSHFGADRSIVGRTIDYDSASIRVVGVMPKGATWPEWASLWRPLTGKLASDPALSNRNFHVDSRVLGRLRPGVSVEHLQAEFRVVQSRLAAAYPGPSAGWIAGEFFPMRQQIIGDVTSMLVLLAAGVFVVLLIACANVSNLSLVRAIARDREMAVRRALGASSRRLARALFTESALVGLAAAMLGVILAAWAIRALRASAPANLPRASELTVDPAVLAVALALSFLTAMLVGAAPVLRLRATGFADPSRQSRHEGASAGAARLRNVVTVAQLALAVALLLCGGLLVQSLRRLQQVNLGYDVDHVASMQLSPPSPRYDRAPDAAALYQRVLDALLAVPGVESATTINHGPGSGGVPTQIVVPGRGAESHSTDVASYHSVSAGFLHTFRIPLVHGRWFTPDDMRVPGDGIVISKSVAERYWPGRNPVGEPITIFGSSQVRADYGQPQPSHVIGVIGDLTIFDSSAPLTSSDVYVPFTRATWPWMDVYVRASLDAAALLAPLGRALRAVDPAIPATGSSRFSVEGRPFSSGPSTRRYVTWLLGAFAASAFVLALIGVYGVFAYGVTQRTHELGVRLALGATPRDLFVMILKQGLWLALLGAAVGVGGGYALTRLLVNLLYGTSPTDAATFGVVPLAVIVTVLVACAVPARRAARLDPMAALRSE